MASLRAPNFLRVFRAVDARSWTRAFGKFRRLRRRCAARISLLCAVCCLVLSSVGWLGSRSCRLAEGSDAACSDDSRLAAAFVEFSRPSRAGLRVSELREVGRGSAVPLSATAVDIAPQQLAWTSWGSQQALDSSLEWLAPQVLRVRIGNDDLAVQLRELCLALEKQGGGQQKSNMNGAFHSRDLTIDPDPALQSLLGQLHIPLAEFLWRLRDGRSPLGGLEGDGPELTVRAVAETAWANVNRPGQWNGRHDHGWPTDSIIASGVYYPAAVDGSRSTSEAKLRLFLEEEVVEVTPEAGTLVLFPTNLPHETDPVPAPEGARVSLAFNVRVRWLDSPLLRAAAAGDAAEISRLVSQGAKLQQSDGVLGLQPLHLAAEAGHLEAVKVLADLGADTAALSWEGWSALGLAFDRSNWPIVDFLGGSKAAAAQALRNGPGYPAPRARTAARQSKTAGGDSSSKLVVLLPILVVVALAAFWFLTG
eukprot:TRINITY_DN41323_c0_g1_i2.p1 TRINITY_DN41323_c0_g1~~TRINITY_DN41323_c0_g1_i2.p1  ORF type:complete len:505 (-),score=88.16 TRINITY_DN41323_c0_g1_i2:63-1499(-)